MSLDELLKGLSVFQDGLKSAAINQSMQEANTKLADINAQFNDQLNQGVDMRKAQEQMLQQKMGLAQQLAGSMVGFGANAADIQQATQFMAPTVGQYEQRQQFQQRQALDEAQFGEQKRQFNVNTFLKRKEMEANAAAAQGQQIDMTAFSPATAQIYAQIPEKGEMRAKAFEELGDVQKYMNGVNEFGMFKDTEGGVATSPDTADALAQAKSISKAFIGGILTGPEARAQFESIQQRFMVKARESMRGTGAQTDKDFAQFIEPNLPQLGDTERVIDEKFKRMSEFILKNPPKTQILSGHGINPVQDYFQDAPKMDKAILNKLGKYPPGTPQFNDMMRTLKLSEWTRSAGAAMRPINSLKPKAAPSRSDLTAIDTSPEGLQRTMEEGRRKAAKRTERLNKAPSDEPSFLDRLFGMDPKIYKGK